MEITAKLFSMFGQLLIFIAILIILGFVTRKWIRSISDYFASGREASWLIYGLAQGSMMLSATTLYFAPGSAIIWGFWTAFFSVFFAAIGYGTIPWVIGKMIRISGVYTVPEWIEARYDSKTRLAVTIACLLALWGVMEPQIFGLGHILSALTGVDYVYCAILSTAIYMTYIFLGGLWAIWVTTIVMGIIIMTALPISWGWLWSAYGSPWDIISQFANVARMGEIGGGLDFLFPGLLTLLAMWLIIPWGAQENWIKSVAIRNDRHLIIGSIFSGIYIALFFTWGLALYGYYALAAYPGVKFDPFAAFPLLVLKAPLGIDGYMLLLLMSAAFTTTGPILLGAGTVVMRDLYQRFVKPEATVEQLVLPGRILTVVFGIISLITALILPWVTWYALSIGAAFIIPTFIPIIVGLLWKRVTPTAAFISATVTAIVQVIWIALGYDATIIHPIWLGLALCLSLIFIITPFTKPKYPVPRLLPTPTATATNGGDLRTLPEEKVKILEAVRSGIKTTAGLIDTLLLEGSKVIKLVDELEAEGLVEREGYRGLKLFKLKLTSEGAKIIDELRPLTSEERELIEKEGLGLVTLKILDAIDKNPGKPTVELAKMIGIHPVQFIAHVDLLDRKGLIKDKGLLKRIILLTDKGRKLLERYTHLLKTT